MTTDVRCKSAWPTWPSKTQILYCGIPTQQVSLKPQSQPCWLCWRSVDWLVRWFWEAPNKKRVIGGGWQKMTCVCFGPQRLLYVVALRAHKGPEPQLGLSIYYELASCKHRLRKLPVTIMLELVSLETLLWISCNVNDLLPALDFCKHICFSSQFSAVIILSQIDVLQKIKISFQQRSICRKTPPVAQTWGGFLC